MSYRKQRVCLFTLLLLAYVLSWLWQSHQLHKAAQLPSNLLLHPIVVTGKIIDIETADSQQIRFIFELYPLHKRVQLSWYYPSKPMVAGQVWHLTIKLKPWHALHNPGLQDSDYHAYLQGWAAHGYIYDAKTALLLNDKAQTWLDKIRAYFYQKISNALPKEPLSLAVISALVLGDKRAMTASLRQLVQATGTAHLLAISGLHIGMIASFVYLIFFRLWRLSAYCCEKIPAKKVGAFFAIMSAFFYTALTGFGLPAIRSFIMVSGVSLAIIMRRRLNTFQTFLIALMAGFILEPFAYFNVSFCLSYLAVFLIFYAGSGRFASSKYIDYIKIQVSISLGLTPLLFYYFNQTSLVGEFANVIAIPLVSLVILPLSFIAILMPFSIISHLLFAVLNFIIQLLLFYLNFLANLPQAVWYKGLANLPILLFAMAGVLILILPRYLRLQLFGIFLLLPVFFFQPNHVKAKTFLVTVLDVGQGLSVLVQTAHHKLLYDLGPLYPGGFSATQSVVVPYLRRHAINRLDALIISHQDSDHRGDLAFFLKNYPQTSIYTSATKALAQFKVQACQQGQHWQWDGVEFRILSPLSLPTLGNNAQSCVLQISTGKACILLPGDIDKKTEHILVKNYDQQLLATALVLAHHGSKTSSSATFLARVKPSYAIISAGFLNRYHFPSTEVLQRLREERSVIFNTGDTGAVQILFSNNALPQQNYPK